MLTAAHCVNNTELGVTVAIGGIDAVQDMPCQMFVDARDWYRHPQYNNDTLENDIALLRLPMGCRLEKPTLAAGVPNNYFLNKTVILSGFGLTNTYSSGILKKTMLTVVPDKECVFSAAQKLIMTASKICTKPLSQEKPSGMCSGDSGSPLIYKDGDVNVLVGVASSSRRVRCDKIITNMYTRVPDFIDWIDSVTRYGAK